MLIKHETALERLAQVDTVVFDKTGTLTTGTPRLTNGASLPRDALELALALSQASAHPLAQAITRAARDAGLAATQVTDITEVPGYGTKGMIDGQEVRLGRASWVSATPRAETATYLKMGKAPPVAFTFADALRPGAEEAVTTLVKQGKRVILMSGDTTPAVKALAERLGIAEWLAEALPADKASTIPPHWPPPMSRSRPPRRWMPRGWRRTSCFWAMISRPSVRPAKPPNPPPDASARISASPRSTTSSPCRWRWRVSARR
jgi:Cu2+-exporting ATPase